MKPRDRVTVDPERGYRPALTDALRRLSGGRSGPPTDDDRPSPSLFPMTPAARAALVYDNMPERRH